jgi:hypothetical protein
MNISRSGYYKWLKTKDILNQYELNRRDLGNLIKDIHKRKPSYGYHRINAVIRREIGWYVSDNLVHKVCKILKIRSRARHYSIYKKPGEESIKYPNLINGNWNTSRPLEKVVTDTTMIWFKKQRYDWTYYVDVFVCLVIGVILKVVRTALCYCTEVVFKLVLCHTATVVCNGEYAVFFIGNNLYFIIAVA